MQYPPPENCSVCEIMLKNIVELGRTQMRNMAHAHCMLHIQGYKHTLRLWNTYCFPPAAMVARTRLLMFCYTYVVCLFYFPLSLFV